jgi:hypothetical protein
MTRLDDPRTSPHEAIQTGASLRLLLRPGRPFLRQFRRPSSRWWNAFLLFLCGLHGAIVGAVIVLTLVGLLLTLCLLLAFVLTLLTGCFGFLFAMSIVLIICHPTTQAIFLGLLGGSSAIGASLGVWIGHRARRSALQQREDPPPGWETGLLLVDHRHQITRP